eukprot:jgi/Psemu1/25625/gm1.25625_g
MSSSIAIMFRSLPAAIVATTVVLWWILAFPNANANANANANTNSLGAAATSRKSRPLGAATETEEPVAVGDSAIGDPANDDDDDAYSDHCTTSADCAFNGECIKTATATATAIAGDSDAGSNADVADPDNFKQQQQQQQQQPRSRPHRIDPEAPGVCGCFPGWKGRTCEVLDLLPVDPQRIGLRLPDRDSSTWGGSVVYDRDDGLYHMFASEIVYGCGLYSWTTNSQVILPTFAHDANIVRAPTGEYVLYVTALSGVIPEDCRKHPPAARGPGMNENEQRHQQFHKDKDNDNAPPTSTSSPRIIDNTAATQMKMKTSRDHRASRRMHLRDSGSDGGQDDDDDDVPPKDTYMLWAPNPEGPWSEPVMVLNSTIYNTDYWKKYNKTARCDSNLNGIILPSNSNDNGDTDTDTDQQRQPFLGLWRRCETEDLLTIPHALVASDWKNASTYQPLVDHPLFVLAGSGAEDPSNIWTTVSSDGTVAYHAIFHDEQATRCMLGACGGQGRHAVSLDGTTWKYANVNAYNRNFRFGTAGDSRRVVRADTRARPHVVLAPDSGGDSRQHQHQQPVALSTGLKERDDNGALPQPIPRKDDDGSRHGTTRHEVPQPVMRRPSSHASHSNGVEWSAITGNPYTMDLVITAIPSYSWTLPHFRYSTLHLAPMLNHSNSFHW